MKEENKSLKYAQLDVDSPSSTDISSRLDVGNAEMIEVKVGKIAGGIILIGSHDHA